MPNCTPSWIASQSRKQRLPWSKAGCDSSIKTISSNPRRRTATPVVSLNRARPNMGHTWTPNCPIYLLPIPNHQTSRSSRSNSLSFDILRFLLDILWFKPPLPLLLIPYHVNGYSNPNECSLSQSRKDRRKESMAL